jgi:hypothetical protein
MELVKANVSLIGDFDGKVDSDIELRFRFCNNGTYYFMAEKKGFWRHAHSGRFRRRSEKNPRFGYPDLRFVTLEPLNQDLPAEREAFGMLHARALPVSDAQEYLLTVWEYPHGLYPNRKIRYFSFSKPDRTGSHSTNWDIQPVEN